MTQPSPLATPMAWNLVADAYLVDVMPVFEAYARDALDAAAPPAGSRILDVACGPGTLSLLAAQRGFAVDALDFSPAMIQHLETRKQATGITNVTARVGDGQALPYADGTFAAGFSMFGLMFFPDRAKGFAELRRVLAPGGRAVVSSWTRAEDVPALAAMFTALRDQMKVLMPSAPPPGGQEMPLSTEDLCRAEMSASFANVEVRRVSHEQRFESSDAMWATFERSMAPFVLMRKMLGEQKWPAIADAARSALRGALGEGAGSITMTALLSIGTAR